MKLLTFVNEPNAAITLVWCTPLSPSCDILFFAKCHRYIEVENDVAFSSYNEFSFLLLLSS